MALTGPQFRSTTEDAPRGWVVKSTSTVYRQAMIARYTNGAYQGFADNVGASASMSVLGIASMNGGALPAGHTLTMSPEILALEQIIAIAFTGTPLTTAHRGLVVYGVDENTGSITQGDGIPVGELIEVIDATHAKVGVGPSFVARAIAAQAVADSASVAAASPFATDEYTDPIVADVAGIHASITFTTDPQTVSTAFVAAGVAEILARPRNFTITNTVAPTHAPTSVVATGTDIDGNALTETLALSSGAGTGVKAFKTFTSFVFTGATSTDSVCSIGFGVKMGLSKTIKSRAGRLAVIQQVAAGSVVTTGTFVSAATSPPHGTYAPATAQDGANDYSITYEHA